MMISSSLPYKRNYLPLRNRVLKSLMMLFLLSLALTAFAENDLIIKGDNQAKYIYRAADDSLKNFFTDELRFSMNYNKFTFGMAFLAYLPKYDQYVATDELNPSQISYVWDERYVSLTEDNYFIQAGTFEESFGNGMLLRAWNDKDMDRDKRLDGAVFKYTPDNLNLKIVYGTLRKNFSDIQLYNNDVVSGIDAEYKLFFGFKMAASVVQYQQKNALNGFNDYNHRNIYGSRMSFLNDLMDINAEYAQIRYEHNVLDPHHGYSFVNTNNIFLGDFTITASYKKYYKYNYNMSDLPSLNHYDQLLSSIANIESEEGLMGEVHYIPNLNNEMTVHYSEAWDKAYDVCFSNIFAEYKRSNEVFAVQTEYEQIETKNELGNSWEKEIHPAVTVDFYTLAFPVTVKGKWGFKDTRHADIEHSVQQPYLQCDMKFTDKWSFSLISEYEFEGWEHFGENSVWMGGELKTSVADNSELKIFAGKEKGGKICRNGVCKYQTAFDGIRVELSTNF